MVHFGGRFEWRYFADHVEPGGTSHPRSAQRNRPEIVEVPDLLLRILDRQVVVVSVFRVDPDTRRNHQIRSERRDHVRHDFFFAQAEFAGVHAIDIQPQRRIVEILRNKDIRSPAGRTDL